jgi:GGDEF domain-containing protein
VIELIASGVGLRDDASRLDAEPFEVQGNTWELGASVGIALSRAGRDRPDALLASADLAMYRAKRR